MVRTKFAMASIMVAFLLAPMAYGQRTRTKLYVWDFAAKNSRFDSLAEKLTGEFEEALIKSNCYQVLERARFDKLARQAANEKMIQSLSNLSSESKQELSVVRAQVVVFGIVDHDVESGEFKVSVSLQSFDSTKVLADSVRLRQGRINDAESREKAMNELIKKICPNTGNSAGGQPSQTKSAVKTAEADFVRFDLIGCRASGPTIICDLTVTNTDNVDKEIMLRPGWDSKGTRAWDNFGNLYNADYPSIANGRETATLTIGTSPKVRITFKGKAQSGTGATKLSKLEILFITKREFTVTFRDICLVEGCDDKSMNSPTQDQQRKYNASSAERSFTIPANQQWLDTGIDVEPGMQLEINASGTISLGQGRQAEPRGITGISTANLFLPMRSAFMGALIAKIRYPNGKESKKVSVGTRNTLVVADNESGRLFLGINDYTMSDNQGSFSVIVRW